MQELNKGVIILPFECDYNMFFLLVDGDLKGFNRQQAGILSHEFSYLITSKSLEQKKRILIYSAHLLVPSEMLAA